MCQETIEEEEHKVWEEYYSALSQLPERLKKPVSFVVDALPLFREKRVKIVLDVGCGSGRHCIYLVGKGFDIVGVDISRSALKMAKAWSKTERIDNVGLVRASMTDLPFVNRCFQAAVSVSVMHHAVKKNIEIATQEVHRVLGDNGIFLANLLSVEDYRYGLGQKVEEGTFRVMEEFEENRFEEIHHFSSKDEALELLAVFREISMESIRGGKEKRMYCYWRVTAIK